MKILRLQLLVGVVMVIMARCTAPDSIPENGVSEALAEWRKSQLANVSYTLDFDIPDQQSEVIPSLIEIGFELSELSKPVVLDFNADQALLHELEINGAAKAFNYKNGHIIIDQENLNIGENKVKIEFTAGDLSLNRNEDYLYTLLVPDRASTAFPCFDQPDIKATYQLTLNVPQSWEVLAGAKVKSRSKNGGKMQYVFAESDLMSTYLFSFVAGRFNVFENDSLKMKLLYRENDSAKINASIPAIFDLHDASLQFLETYTNYPFPFQKLDFAAIPGFQYGGMEHVGAIQYRESSLFLDESATERQLLNRAKLIAHETAHMWFGDLVTMRWFNDVWMKEVFANFMADKIMNPVFPEINHQLKFMMAHYPAAYAVDRTRGSNPIRQQLNNLKDAGSMYGSIIYHKAPIMMRQLEQLVGEAAFRRGIQEYIATYQNDNADWNELIHILDQQTEVDLIGWSGVWVNQSGRPVISVDLEVEDGKIESLKLKQHAEDGSDHLWSQAFEVALVYADEIKKVNVALTDAELRLTEVEGWPSPLFILYNSDAMGYGIFPVDENSVSGIVDVADEVMRAIAYLNAFENTLNAQLDQTQLLEVLKEGLATEKNELILGMIADQISTIYWHYLSDAERSTLQKTLAEQAFSRMREEKVPGISKRLFSLFKSLGYGQNEREMLYQIWKKDLAFPALKLNEDDYTSLAMTLALYEHPDAETILTAARDQIKNADKLARFDFLQPALSADPGVRRVFFESFADAKNREKESWVLSACAMIHHPLRQDEAQQYLGLSLELLEEIQQTGDIFFPKGWLDATIGQYQSEEALAKVEEYLEQHPNLNPQLKAKVLQSTDDLARYWR